MTDNKTVQTILRTTKTEKEMITQKANELNLSINEYIKNTLLNNINQNNNNNINNDINNDIINILKQQVENKDKQIQQLHQLLFQSQQKLLSPPEKKWYQFWKF